MRLASDGLAQTESHRGARVRKTTQEKLRDLMETRRAIERLRLARSIERGDAA